MPWLLIPWLLSSRGHSQPQYWLCRRKGFFPSFWKDFNYLCHLDINIQEIIENANIFFSFIYWAQQWLIGYDLYLVAASSLPGGACWVGRAADIRPPGRAQIYGGALGTRRRPCCTQTARWGRYWAGLLWGGSLNRLRVALSFFKNTIQLHCVRSVCTICLRDFWVWKFYIPQESQV